VRTARETLRDLRVAEVAEQDIHIDGNGGNTYRTKLRLSFKYQRAETGLTAVSASDQAMTDGSLPQTATVGIRGSPVLEAS
jgi:hypothetical protein